MTTRGAARSGTEVSREDKVGAATARVDVYETTGAHDRPKGENRDRNSADREKLRI